MCHLGFLFSVQIMTNFLVYWHMVACENYWHSKSEEYIISNLMHIIFHWFHDYAFPKQGSRYQPLLEKLRGDIYAHPEYDWTLGNDGRAG